MVRHQRSLALEFTCACPGWEVVTRMKFHRSKISVLLVVTKHQMWLFLQTSSSCSPISPLKAEDSVTVTSGVSMTYSSSTDDTSSLGTPSAISQASTEAPTSDPCPEKPMSPGASPVSGETEEEEKKDRLTDVPERSAILRTTIRSLSPFRRHSWGPGKNSAGETEISQRR